MNDVLDDTKTCSTNMQDVLNFPPSEKCIRLVLGLPFDVKHKIFKRIPLPFTAFFINGKCLKYQRTFELACRNNNIYPTNRADIDWRREFSSIWENFNMERFHKEPDWTWTTYMDTKIGMEITGRKLFVLEDYTKPTKDIEDLMITLELTQLKNPPSGNQRKTHVLSQTYELHESTLHCNFVLGNRHDILYSGQETLTSRLTFQGSANTTKLAFDEEDRVYYYETTNDLTRFFRKTFGTPDEPEIVYSIELQIDMIDLSVGSDKLFITYNHRYYNPYTALFVACLDLIKPSYRLVRIIDFVSNYNVVVHNNCFVFSEIYNSTIIYHFNENGMTPYNVQGERRQVLNRNTYLILEKMGDKSDYMLKTLTILDDGPIVQFVQFCQEECVFRRLGDNFFYVLEPNRRQLYYQDDNGSSPIRLAEDAKCTTIKSGRRGYEFSAGKRVRSYRKWYVSCFSLKDQNV